MTVTFSFDRDASYFPLSGKLDDLFDDKFKLTIIINVEDPETVTLCVAVLWKGVAYVLLEEELSFTEAGVYIGEVTWVEPPTIAEFLQMFGEELPGETTEYSYSWIVGKKLNDEMSTDDKWDTSLLVEVAPFPWEIALPLAGIAVAITGIVIAARK